MRCGLIAVAANDDTQQPRGEDVLRESVRRGERPRGVEVFPDQHG